MTRSRKKFARNHQSAWLYGEHAVRAMLETPADRLQWAAAEVLAVDADAYAENAAAISVVPTPAARIAELVKTDDHQGVAARMPEFPYAHVASLRDAPRVLILDRIQYPMNFGTMLRSAEVFGVRDVLIGTAGQCGVTAAVARMSVGSVFRTRVARADDLAGAVRELRRFGQTVYAATLDRSAPCHEVDLRNRASIIIGRESDGVSTAVQDACDGRVLIPQLGCTQSLNAAASAAILLYESARQRGFEDASTEP